MSCTEKDLVAALEREARESRFVIAYHDVLMRAADAVNMCPIERAREQMADAARNLRASIRREPDRERWLMAQVRGYEAAIAIIDAYYYGEGA